MILHLKFISNLGSTFFRIFIALCVTLTLSPQFLLAETIRDKTATDHSLKSQNAIHTIPFRYINGFILVDLIIDKKLPLTFLFDTGSKHHILTEPQLAIFLEKSFTEHITILGSDRSQAINGTLKKKTLLKLGDLNLVNQNLIAIKEGVLDLEALTGEQVQGILGVSAFGAYTVNINYKSKVIKLYKDYHPSKESQTLKIDIEDSKAYLNLLLKVHTEAMDTVKLLIDTGASLELLLHLNNKVKLRMPKKTIPGNFGTGLGGDLYGYIGRSEQLIIEEHQLNGIITYFQVLPDSINTYNAFNRSGLVGNAILDRYNIFINYPKSQIHLIATKQSHKKRRYDRAGMKLIHAGPSLNDLLVQYVIPNSPADSSGIKIGDQILSINYIPSNFWTVESAERFMKKKISKPRRIKLKRGNKTIKTAFKLKKLI